jgi:capsular polysaccharide export protein
MERKGILIVTDRSNYFSFLGSQLENDFDVYYIAVWKNDEIFLKERGISYLSRESLLKNDLSSPTGGILIEDDIRNALFADLQYDVLYNNGNHRNSILTKGMNYARAIDKFTQEHRINLVIVQNDSWNYASIPLAVARKKNIKTLIFEDGFFRPDTIVLDRKGVNKNNSCPREKAYYESIAIDKSVYSIFLEKELLKGSGPLVNIPSYKSLSHVIKTCFDYLKHPRKTLRVILLAFDLMFFLFGKKSFILLPLQVRSDSQIICHSSVNDMAEFIDICLASIESYNKKNNRNISVVIKEHPKDTHINLLCKTRRQYRDVKSYYLANFNTRRLIEQCSTIITINSTIGIEGLLYYKPVITLGNAFYNIEGLVHYCDNFKKLDQIIECAINSHTDRRLVDNFLFYLKFYYQVDGDLNNPNRDNIMPVVSRIREALDNEV